MLAILLDEYFNQNTIQFNWMPAFDVNNRRDQGGLKTPIGIFFSGFCPVLVQCSHLATYNSPSLYRTNRIVGIKRADFEEHE